MRWRIPLRPPVVVVERIPEPEPPPQQVVEVEEVVDGEVTTSAFSVRYLFWRAVMWTLIALGIQAVASLMPAVVELVYSQTFYYYISRYLSVVNRFFGFSLGEVFFAAICVWFIVWTLWYLRRAVRGETRYIYVFRLLFLHMAWTASMLWVVFLLIWGLNYERMPITDTMGLERRPARSDELNAMGERILQGINRNYALAREGQEWGGASSLPLTNSKLFQVIEQGFQNTALLAEASQGGFGQPKPLYFSPLSSWFGISGFYMPYSGESTYNIFTPPSELPFLVAHQKAHQRGYAREDEANFVAYLVCTNSPEAYVRYSGFLHGIKVLAAIERANVGRFRERVGPGPSADLEARFQFWEGAKSPPLNLLSKRVYSGHLRLNRVRRGLENFDEDVALIIGYYLKNPPEYQEPQPRQTLPE